MNMFNTIKSINTIYAINQYKKVRDAITDTKIKLYKENKHVSSKVENKGKHIDVYV